MTTSAEELCGLDTVILVYALLADHPASETCAAYLSSRSQWLTTPPILWETRSVLWRVYGVDPEKATQSLWELVKGPLVVNQVTGESAVRALELSTSLSIDVTDAALILACGEADVKRISTDDRKLANAANSLGIMTESPVPDSLRPAIAQYEENHLPPKGLPRTLHHVRDWLARKAPGLVDEFWSDTGAGNRLP